MFCILKKWSESQLLRKLFFIFKRDTTNKFFFEMRMYLDSQQVVGAFRKKMIGDFYLNKCGLVLRVSY